jgi:hypothetical protein
VNGALNSLMGATWQRTEEVERAEVQLKVIQRSVARNCRLLPWTFSFWKQETDKRTQFLLETRMTHLSASNNAPRISATPKLSVQASLTRKRKSAFEYIVHKGDKLVKVSAALQSELQQQVIAKYDTNQRKHLSAAAHPFIKVEASTPVKAVSHAQLPIVRGHIQELARELGEQLLSYQHHARVSGDSLYGSSALMAMFYDGCKDETHHTVAPKEQADSFPARILRTLFDQAFVLHLHQPNNVSLKNYHSFLRARLSTEGDGSQQTDEEDPSSSQKQASSGSSSAAEASAVAQISSHVAAEA